MTKETNMQIWLVHFSQKVRGEHPIEILVNFAAASFNALIPAVKSHADDLRIIYPDTKIEIDKISRGGCITLVPDTDAIFPEKP